MGWYDDEGNLAPLFKTPEHVAAGEAWAATSPQPGGMGGVYIERCDIATVVPSLDGYLYAWDARGKPLPNVKLDGADTDPNSIGLGKPAAGGSTTTVTVTLPSGKRQLAFQAVDAAGNVGAPATLPVPAPGQSTGGGGRAVGVPGATRAPAPPARLRVLSGGAAAPAPHVLGRREASTAGRSACCSSACRGRALAGG